MSNYASAFFKFLSISITPDIGWNSIWNTISNCIWILSKIQFEKHYYDALSLTRQSYELVDCKAVQSFMEFYPESYLEFYPEFCFEFEFYLKFYLESSMETHLKFYLEFYVDSFRGSNLKFNLEPCLEF